MDTYAINQTIHSKIMTHIELTIRANSLAPLVLKNFELAITTSDVSFIPGRCVAVYVTAITRNVDHMAVELTLDC